MSRSRLALALAALTAVLTALAARSARLRAKLPDPSALRSKLPGQAGGATNGSGLASRITAPGGALRSRLPGPLGGGSQPGDADWRCQCGARYRVTGTDRHRVFWAAGADESHPVLEDACPECGTPFPGTVSHDS